MIEAFRRIGEEILKDNASKKEILNSITLRIDEKINNEIINRPIFIDLNLEKGLIEIEIGKQAEKEKRYDYFVFDKGSSPHGKKIYLNVNNIGYHLTQTIPELIDKIKKNGDNEKYNPFLDLSEKLKKEFYIEIKPRDKKNKKKFRFYLNYNKLNKEDKELFLKEFSSKQEKEKQKNKGNKKTEEDLIIDSFESVISSKLGIKETDLSNFQICILKINGKNILETEFADAYINIVYQEKIGRFFYDKDKYAGEKICHCCNKKVKVTNNVDIPAKFYMTDKKGFSENMNDKSFYKSFALCEECYKKILSGINFVDIKLSSTFEASSFYLIPKSESFFKGLEDNVEYLDNKIKHQIKPIAQKELNIINDQKKKSGFLFDLLFYQPSKNQDFKILKNISDISLLNVERIDTLLQEMSFNSKKGFFNKLKINIGLFSFKEVLFSNDYYKSESVKKVLTTDLLEWLGCVYNNIDINRKIFIEQFLTNYKKNYFENKKSKDNNYFNTFKALFLINFLIKLGLWKENKMEIKTYSNIENKELKKFFETHTEIDDLRKGFVVLGYLINKIIWIQKSDGKTSTFMNKINFDGTDKMDLQELTNDLKEYLHIYRNHEKMIKSEPEELFVWEITSKYLNDEKLKTSPEEITFYIILGIHLGAYIKQ